MNRRKPEAVGSFMDAYFAKYGLQDKINEARAVMCWQHVVEDKVLSRTKTIFAKNKVLYVFFHSAPLRNEMMLRRADLIERINQILGSKVIENIIFQ